MSSTDSERVQDPLKAVQRYDRNLRRVQQSKNTQMYAEDGTEVVNARLENVVDSTPPENRGLVLPQDHYLRDRYFRIAQRNGWLKSELKPDSPQNLVDLGNRNYNSFKISGDSFLRDRYVGIAKAQGWI